MSNNLSTMLKAESQVKKPETMNSVWIRTADGFIQEVEQEVAIISPKIDAEFKSGLGSSKSNPISLVPKVGATTLSLVFDYCRFDQVCGSHEERKNFDENFLQMDTRTLFEMVTLASYLQLGPLIVCTSKEMAQRISNNSTEELWHMLNLDIAFPKVEKLELRGNSAVNSKIRCYNKLYKNKKQSVLKELENLKNFMAGLKVRQDEDTRNVDDLVSFINGGDKDSQTLKKKKNRKKRAQKKTSSPVASSSSEASSLKKATENHDQDPSTSNSPNNTGSSSASFKVKEVVDYSDLDPAVLEKIESEVVEFAKRFNLSYPDLIC